MMLKIILCAYTQSAFSGRKIEALFKDRIRMMWLAQGYEPSYRNQSFPSSILIERSNSPMFRSVPLSIGPRRTNRSRSPFY